MLDECKGDRLEEVLAVFSSAVLKKAVAEQQLNNREFPAVAHSLALEKKGYSGERTELNALILAHTVSLRRKLDEKNAARLHYKNLAVVLDTKEESIAKRSADVRSKGKTAKVSNQQRTDVRRTVRNNWAGNERWMEALLYGDAYAKQDGVLSTPFDRVWRRTRSDRLPELEDKTNGLLRQLDDRVRTQQERLLKWQSVKKDMFGERDVQQFVDSDARIGQRKGFDFGFDVHESLQLGRMSPRNVAENTPTDLGTEYQGLLESFERDMKAIDRVVKAPIISQQYTKPPPPKSPTHSQVSDKAADEPISELSELEEEIAKASKSGRHIAERPTEVVDKTKRPKLPQPLSTMHSFRPKATTTEIPSIEPLKPDSPKALSHSSVRSTKEASPSPVPSPIQSVPPSPPRNSPPRRTQSPEELPPSPTQQQADQILASMNAASPSPVKQSRPRPTLSLADRTRLSMSRSTTLEFDADEDDDGQSPTRPRRRNTTSRSPKKKVPSTPTTITEADVDDENDLIARTRKSMANFEAAQQKARLERQRSQKHAAKQSSQFARQKYFISEQDEDSTEVLEELIAKEAEIDYEDVFKSRPKIKASPPATPVNGRGRDFSWDGDEEDEL